ncbi:unnamed protein product, partial [Scytosiphon promiscuus]
MFMHGTLGYLIHALCSKSKCGCLGFAGWTTPGGGVRHHLHCPCRPESLSILMAVDGIQTTVSVITKQGVCCSNLNFWTWCAETALTVGEMPVLSFQSLTTGAGTFGCSLLQVFQLHQGMEGVTYHGMANSDFVTR